MNHPITQDWVVPVLTDIAEFLSANGTAEGAAAVAKAAAVVSEIRSVKTEFGPPAPLNSPPMVEGNIIRFCVYSRNRR